MTTTISIRVTPRSSKPGIGGWRAGADGRQELEVRVAEAPADGEANAAVIRQLAKALGVPKAAVEIVSGETSRYKRVRIDRPPDEVRGKLGFVV